MLTTLRRGYVQLVTSGAQLLLLFVGIKLESRTGWLWCLGIMSIVSLFAWYSALRRLRTISATPTSRIASAAQGYVELIGRGRPGATPLISKLRVLPCLWYRWKVEQRNSKNQWSTLDKGESSDYFVLRDDSGDCIVDPEQAEIITKHRDEWTDGSYRYTEWKLIQDDYLYVIGEFKTVGGSNTSLTHDDLVKQVLSEWKMDNADLLKRFDLDNNGVLDMREWILARSAARREAEKRLIEAFAEPDTHFMLRPHNGRLFLISNLDQDKLALRYKLWAWAHVVIFFGALLGITWLLQVPAF
ncbi:MAG: E3 ubiquitin ligase family protein [Gammaproteobacteria bacterium]|nr:E3 ubiquitin ligase family protein [Gammaproteobacteria bacterium]MBU1481057.1 E3 ubiquitin ligase family protein [Gammaproteobacteria bacterium]